MRTLAIVTIFLIVVVSAVNAQSQTTYVPYFNKNINQSDTINAENDTVDDLTNHLTIISDTRINELIEIQKEESSRRGTIEGYRIQIYQGSKKSQAYELEAKFLSKFQGYEVYVRFYTPDFRVRIGDFRSRSEAIKLKKIIEKDFPNPFIVEDDINLPKLFYDEQMSKKGE